MIVVPRPAFYPRRWGFSEVQSVNLGDGITVLIGDAEATQGPVNSVTGKMAMDNKAALEKGGIRATPRAKSLTRLGFTEHKYDPKTGIAVSRKPVKPE